MKTRYVIARENPLPSETRPENKIGLIRLNGTNAAKVIAKLNDVNKKLKTEEANTFYEKVLIKIEELRQNGNFSGLMITTKNEAHEFFIDFNLPTQKYNRLQEVE